ncbi:MAG: single-stranded-DNA-specific exonuclease RecJ [Chloroflexi bacterium]|nr:single-stranded-DNA-specific exonuclease RecJ [Chloroflexota bacterium]
MPPAFLALFPELPGVVAAVLYQRGLGDAAAARTFLAPQAAPLHDTALLPDIAPALDRLAAAVRAAERIALYGDYDVDGVTSLALFGEALRLAGAEPLVALPRRDREGYGLHMSAVTALAEQGTRVLVTLDHGVGAAAEVAEARRRGIDVIVLDHHEVPPRMPPALALIDPKRADSRYPFRDLASVGLAYKLATALLERAAPAAAAAFADRALDLVALGTVADVAPLVDENRGLVARGLAGLNAPAGGRVGLRALCAVAGVWPGRIRARTVSHTLGPRLNAAGRLDDARLSFDLLTTQDTAQAEHLARALDELNRERQALTEQLLVQAERDLDGGLPLALVGGPDYHLGVIGIVAARLVDRWARPAVVLHHGAAEVRGSARSVEGFDVAWALRQCAHLLTRNGGHERAAGFALAPEQLGPFQHALQALARERLGDKAAPPWRIDAEVRMAELTFELARALDLLEPFGEGNPPPLLLLRRVRVGERRRVGRPAPGAHLALLLTDGRRRLRAIGFDMGERIGALPDVLDALGYLELRELPRDGTLELRLRLCDLRPAA